MVELLLYILFFIAVSYIYFLPSIIAFRRHHPHRWPILAIDVLFGATGIGWLGTLVWALRIVQLPGKDKRSTGEMGGMSVLMNDLKSVRVFSPPPARPAKLFSTEAAMKLVERLMQLRTDASLTEEEYQSMKAAVLSQMT